MGAALAALVLVIGVGGLLLGEDEPPVAAEPTAAPSNIVHVGAYVNNIEQVDLEYHLYTIDFLLWFRWTDPAIHPTATIIFVNDADQWATTTDLATEEPMTLADGSLYQREHVKSRFSTNMPLEQYPFDHQSLKIVLEDRHESASVMQFVPDDPAAVSAPNLSVPGYRIGEPVLTTTIFQYPELGVTGQGPKDVSRVTIAIPMTRPWLPYALKIFVPFIVVVLCTALVFLISPSHADVRFGLGISALLTLVALKWTTDGQMPLVDFVGMVDWLYLVAFAFVGLSLLETTYTTWRRTHGVDDVALERIDHRVLLVSSIVFLATCALVIVGLSR